MTSIHPLCSLENPDHPLVEDAARACSKCGAALCLRKQVINLALGLTEQMMCLTCLSAENEQSTAEVLSGIKDYVLSRECFAKQWKRYTSMAYCPDRAGCIPAQCFE